MPAWYFWIYILSKNATKKNRFYEVGKLEWPFKIPLSNLSNLGIWICIDKLVETRKYFEKWLYGE